MSDELTKLEELAKAATPGLWYRGAQNDATFVIAGREPSPDNEFQNPDAPREVIARVTEKADEKFIAAANPAVVLSLISSIRALEEENKRLEGRVLELQHHAYEWMVAHDKLHAGKPYKFPSPVEPDALSKALEENKRLRELADYADRAHSYLLRYASLANAGKAELNGREMARQVGAAFYEFNQADHPYIADLRHAAAELEKK